ncbi:MAG TPA: 2-C-methyl-D-erythritol 2,4-cyclodiphosphate synthase [bacterium]|nr:2-C-methyl-D-erythritol 2,4-cyclodiphosphate synthase [bacterium]
MSFRVGCGWDAHAFGGDGPLKLGGVEVPGARGLSGHSDADVLAHAVCDAILGAAGLPDIGAHFPDDDPQYEGADSVGLLRMAAGYVAEKKYRAVNVDAVIIAQEPRLAPFFLRMRENIAAAVGLSPEDVSVKAASPEGLGAVGRGEGIAAQAVALLKKTSRSGS